MSAATSTLAVSDARVEEAVRDYERDGFARLGRVASDEVLTALRRRADELMDGTVRYEGMFFQRDAESGAYRDLPYGRGFEGPTKNYRKIEKLELDPVFYGWLENSVFERVARLVLGPDAFLLRAMMMTKPANGGTPLPWHQDGGLFWGVAPAPRLQLWTALDDAPAESGAVEVLPGSHRLGLATPMGGVVPNDVFARLMPEPKPLVLPAAAGEVLLIHNLCWHRSGINTTPFARRAFSICLVDESVKCTRTKRAPRVFPRVFPRTALSSP